MTKLQSEERAFGVLDIVLLQGRIKRAISALSDMIDGYLEACNQSLQRKVNHYEGKRQ